MFEDESRVAAARRTVMHDAFEDGLAKGLAGERLRLVGIPYEYRLHWARGWVRGSTMYAATLLKAKGEAPHAAFFSATRRYLNSQRSLERMGLRWPESDEAVSDLGCAGGG